MTTPTCPNCGSKFSHDNQKQVCKKCGIPDQVLAKGSGAIKRWNRNKLPGTLQGSFELKGGQVRRKTDADNKPNKHGRKGVKRATSVSKRPRYRRRSIRG